MKNIEDMYCLLISELILLFFIQISFIKYMFKCGIIKIQAEFQIMGIGSHEISKKGFDYKKIRKKSVGSGFSSK